ncbi:NAD(P)-dependent oxidoreductase [Aquirufa sp. ROCK-SH2]
MSKQVLIIDEIHESMIIGLENQGFRAIYLPQIEKEQIATHLSEISGLVVRSKIFIDEDFLEKAPHLEFIARAGAGLDLINLEATKKRNIQVFAANEGNKDAVAEHVIGQLLSLAHRLHIADIEVKNRIWDREGNRGWEIHGKTIGIIGFGNMGQALAEKIQGFGVSILAYDKYHPAKKFAASLEDLFEQADIVSLHVPLTEETKGMISKEFLMRFKKNIVLINSSRGQIGTMEAYLWGLETKKIKALALDVLPNEKLKSWSESEINMFNSISKFPNTIFSPHVAGWTNESYWKINEVLLEKIKSYYHS